MQIDVDCGSSLLNPDPYIARSGYRFSYAGDLRQINHSLHHRTETSPCLALLFVSVYFPACDAEDVPQAHGVSSDSHV